MSRIHSIWRIIALAIGAGFVFSGAACTAQSSATAPVGVARVDITPETPVRMYGYASRKIESEGVAQRLTASALVIGQDGGDGPAVLLSVENGATPVKIRTEVLRRLQTKTGLKPERFMLCNTHIHSGPDLDGMEGLKGEQRQHMEKYAALVTDKLEQVVLQAMASRKPARLDWSSGAVNFAMNRRVLKDGKWSGFGAVKDAPADHALPLLRVTDEDGKLMALLVNYACHDTTLRPNFKQLHGDWAGCAQEFIEADNPGAVALVALGCAADADPYPHGTVELCQEHGREVADAVKKLLAGGAWKPIAPRIAARMKMLEIPFDDPPTGEELKAYAARTYSPEQTLQLLANGQKLPPRQYMVATWTFGDDLAMVFLSNEVVVDYALRLRREFDPGRLWINAYSNEVTAYIPSNRLMGEGGYEVNNSLAAQVTYGHAERLKPTLEDRIMTAVHELLPQTFAAAQR